MAGSEEFDALVKLLRATSAEAVPAAEDAAAVVYRDAARAAAPRKTGQLAGSIKVIEGRPQKDVYFGQERKRLFVGPEKKKGYYGYFLEKGHRATGRAEVVEMYGPRWRERSWTEKTRRLARPGKGPTHNQRGTSNFTKVPARPWFEPSQRAVDSSAVRAAEAAFERKLRELDSRI